MKKYIIPIATLLCVLLLTVACSNTKKDDGNMVSSLVSDTNSTLSDLVSKGNSMINSTVSRLEPGNENYHAPNAQTVH